MQVNLAQATNLIHACGTTNTFLLRGAPGVGKSSILTALSKLLPDYAPACIDVANLDLGDLGMPVIDKERMVTNYAPNARFCVANDQTRPVLLMLDELGKASRPVLNMLLPVILEQRIGDRKLPTGSIVFGTTNLDTDGVGDAVPAHAYNRMTVLDVANPTVDEWLTWAVDSGIAPEVMAFVREYPQVMQRYDSLGEHTKNPYIFNPRSGQTKAFCSPRSLEKASNIIKQRDALGGALQAALAGTIGTAAAADMDAFVHLADQLPRYEAVLTDPAKCALPGGAGAYFLMAFSLASRAVADNMDALMTYTNRWESFEARTLFISTLAGTRSKVEMACRNQAFTKACAEVGKFF